LKYQRGSFLLGFNPGDMEPEKLRKLLIGAIGCGSNMTLRYRTIDAVDDLTKYFVPGCFPPEVLSKNKILDESVWSTLLRPDEGDKQAHEFLAMDGFCLMVVTETETYPPECLEYFEPILVSSGKAPTVNSKGEVEDDVAKMFGAKEIKKNSKDLVEAGFDGELEDIKQLVDKGYHIDSEDGRGHTAMSEAASQGHDHVIKWLLSQGADPNLGNDNKRTPMYRAAFNGHVGTIKLLLEKGGDREIVDKSNGEKPFDCAKDNETREVLEQWDYTLTEKLLEERAAEIRKKLEERIVTAADREALARQLITEELCLKAETGDCDGLKSLLMEQAEEADRTEKRPLVSASAYVEPKHQAAPLTASHQLQLTLLRPQVTCEARSSRGQTLLSLAVQYGHAPIVELLCNHHKTCDLENFALNPGEHSWEYRTFKANVNSRENKGWNVCSIAVFHEQKACLQVRKEQRAAPVKHAAICTRAATFFLRPLTLASLARPTDTSRERRRSNRQELIQEERFGFESGRPRRGNERREGQERDPESAGGVGQFAGQQAVRHGETGAGEGRGAGGG